MTNLGVVASSSLLIILAVALLGLAMVVILGVVKLARLKPEAGAADTSGFYHRRPSILSPAERSFAGVLDGALPEGVTWIAKVRLGDIVVTRKGLTPSQRATAWNRINQKHVDFLLVRVSDFAPLGGIELDDRSHDEDDRKQRDLFVDEVCRSCSLPLLHQPAQSAYNQADLRTKIASMVAA